MINLPLGQVADLGPGVETLLRHNSGATNAEVRNAVRAVESADRALKL